MDEKVLVLGRPVYPTNMDIDMEFRYQAGEDLKKGDFITLGPDGRMYRSRKMIGCRQMMSNVKAGEKVIVIINRKEV